MYNNLLYLLIVILVFSTKTVPASALIPGREVLLVFLCKAYLYYRLVRAAHRPGRIENSREYFAAEQRFSILAILFYAMDIYLLDIKFFLAMFSAGGRLPVLTSLAGVGLFFVYLSLMWEASRQSYGVVFEKKYSSRSFLVSNIKANLPIILPWLILSLIFDIIQLLPFPALKLPSIRQWSEPLLLLLFFIALAFVFPALIKRLWNCTPLPAGAMRSHIEEYCRRQDFSYTDILIWPLFEGRVMTAGIMGISRRLRFLLITPSLLETLRIDELNAVLSHEIGHAKKYHLQLYLVLFLGFALFINIMADPLLYLLLSTDLFYWFVSKTGNNFDSALAVWGTVPLLLVMIIYFRYIFGFFMRNFERQADLHVFQTQKNPDPLISSLEKIAWLSGNIRDLPSWHHFGIAQRVDFLEKCRANPDIIKRHNRKVLLSVCLYILILLAGAFFINSIPMQVFEDISQNKLTEAIIKERMRAEPGNATWLRLLADFMQDRGKDYEAAAYYAKALRLLPDDPELLNNFAWLLVMSSDRNVYDPARGLELAQLAAETKPEGYILDTLATAYWANGFLQKALSTEKRAIVRDPANREYYLQQVRMFDDKRKI